MSDPKVRNRKNVSLTHECRAQRNALLLLRGQGMNFCNYGIGDQACNFFLTILRHRPHARGAQRHVHLLLWGLCMHMCYCRDWACNFLFQPCSTARAGTGRRSMYICFSGDCACTCATVGTGHEVFLFQPCDAFLTTANTALSMAILSYGQHGGF